MYKFAINRPITTIMMAISLIVFGLISFRSMPVALFPNVDLPIITIQTVYAGADAQTVESKVTDKIEEAVSGVDGIDKLRSTSYEGLSIVTVQFELSKDIEEAANDIRDKISALRLDPAVESPNVQKLGSAASASIKIFISDNKNDEIALMRFADEVVKPKMQQVMGVAKVDIIGFREREIRIFTDPFLLNKYSISSDILESKIRAENVRLGGGKLIDDKNEIIIKTRSDATTIEELKNIIISDGVRLGDVATVTDGLSDIKSYSSLNGKSGVIVEVKKIAGKNDLEIIKGVKKALPMLEAIAKDNYTLTITEDVSSKILININNVKFDLIYGSILAIIIVFLFLRNLTATLISAIAIPTSIIGTFALIDYLGYDLNRLTLIGLTLAIGIFIDDAIVVTENISKKLESGMDAPEASYNGVKEIAFSILAISSMLLAVFIPVAFMDGIVGMFFNSFAMTVASGIFISYMIAIMLIPTIGARVLKGSESRFWHISEPYFVRVDMVYKRFLELLLRFKWITLFGVFLILIASFALASRVGGTFVPLEDMGEMRVLLKANPDISTEQMKREIEPILKIIQEDKYTKDVSLSIGYNSAQEINKANIYASLIDINKREPLPVVLDSFRKKLEPFKNFTISVEDVPPMDTGESNSPVQVVLMGPDFAKLQNYANEISKTLSEIKGVEDIDSDYEAARSELKITIKREIAQRLGISAEQIARAIGSNYSSDSATSHFEQDGRQYDITLRASDKYRALSDEIKKIQLQTKDGEFVFIDGLIEISKDKSEASINRFDRDRKILVTANLNGVNLDVVVDALNNKLSNLLEDGYRYRYTGDIELMDDTAAAFGYTVLLAVLLIYLILASLYESFLQPLIIMVSMPLSFTGVSLALFLTGNPFSVFVMIGLMLLMGMVGKNGVLVVDFANSAIKAGKNIDDAILEAGAARLRPILMTTFAMIFAMLPLAISSSAGHESNSPMAIAIIGGLISSTILALFVVPVLYKLLYPIDSKLKKMYERPTLQ